MQSVEKKYDIVMITMPNELTGDKESFQSHIIQMFNQTEVDAREIPVDMFHYTILANKNIEIEGNNYEAEIKICRPEEDMVIVRVTLYSKEKYAESIQNTRRTSRLIRSIHNPTSENDYVLGENELAFCYQNIDLSQSPVTVRSRLEVHSSMKRRGIGNNLFLAYEALAKETISRLEVPDNKKNIRLIVRDNSEPKGWTQKKAEVNGYRRIGKYEDLSSPFPTFVKDI